MGLKEIIAGAILGTALTMGACEEEVSECCQDLECGTNSVCTDYCKKNECTKTHCIELDDGDKECCGCKYQPDDDYDYYHGMSDMEDYGWD